MTPGTTTKPTSITFTAAFLTNRGLVTPASIGLVIPDFATAHFGTEAFVAIHALADIAGSAIHETEVLVIEVLVAAVSDGTSA